jgi:Ca2+-dependent lipid-binding protein
MRSKKCKIKSLIIKVILIFYEDSLCEARMGSQKYMTHTVETSLNPKWNTSMQFLIFDFQKDILNITVYDRKIFSPNFFLGRINLSMAQLRKEHPGDGVSIIKAFNLSDVRTGKIIIKLNLMLN